MKKEKREEKWKAQERENIERGNKKKKIFGVLMEVERQNKCRSVRKRERKDQRKKEKK